MSQITTHYNTYTHRGRLDTIQTMKQTLQRNRKVFQPSMGTFRDFSWAVVKYNTEARSPKHICNQTSSACFRMCPWCGGTVERDAEWAWGGSGRCPRISIPRLL